MTEQECWEKISAQLRECGVKPGSVILVHSSLKALGQVPGGPATVIAGLLDVLGPQGTLLLPALSYASVNAENPVFDEVKTPCCVGAIPEYFRTMPNTRRSIHPTHSVCGQGKYVHEIFANHQLDTTPCGPHSPFSLLPNYNGSILFLGCGLWPNTSMHGVEELVEPPYLFGKTIHYRIIHADGTETFMDNQRHNFAGWQQSYDRVGEILAGDDLRSGKVLEATVQVMQAAAFWEKATAVLKKDPFYFVKRKS